MLFARVLDGGKYVRFRDGDEGIALIVLKINVEVWPILGNEVALQYQRFMLIFHYDVVKAPYHLHHQRDLGAIVLQRHVLSHTTAQVFCLAYIDNFARTVLPQIAAGTYGNLINLLSYGNQIVKIFVTWKFYTARRACHVSASDDQAESEWPPLPGTCI